MEMQMFYIESVLCEESMKRIQKLHQSNDSILTSQTERKIIPLILDNSGTNRAKDTRKYV